MPKKKFVKFFDDTFVGENLLKEGEKMLDKNTVYLWHTWEVYGKDSKFNPYHDIAAAKYKQLGIDYMDDIDELRNRLGSSNDNYFWNRHNLKEYWSQYLRRDRLIAAGVYEKARAKVYINNYLKAVGQFIGENEILDKIEMNLNNLTLEEFQALIRPSPYKDNKDNEANRNLKNITTALPSVQDFYGVSGVKNAQVFYEDILKRFKTAFKEADLKWIGDEEQPNVSEQVEDKDVVVSETQRYDRELREKVKDSAYGKALKVVYRSSSNKAKTRIMQESEVINDTFDERREALRALRIKEIDMAKRGKNMIKTNKRGEYYIPFIRKDIVRDYIRTFHGK